MKPTTSSDLSHEALRRLREARADALTLTLLDPTAVLRSRRTRQRKPSIAALIRQARKAGERGPVSVTLPDGVTITSASEAAIEQMTEADAERLWLERAAKHAH